MNITPIQMTNQNNQSFTGRIAIKGQWPTKLENAFLNSKGIKELADEGYNVTGSLSHKIAGETDTVHTYQEKLYELKLNVQKENPTILDRIKNLIGLSTHTINKNHHSETTIKEMLQNVDAKFFHKRIGKKSV